jgi:hypothetical protein
MDKKKAIVLKESLKSKKKTLRDTLEEYRTINIKLNEGLDVSLSIIVDLSKMLKHYHDLLNAIQTFVDEPIEMAEDVKDLAEKAYDRLTSTFNEHIDDIISAYPADSEAIRNLVGLKNKVNEVLTNVEKEVDTNKNETSKTKPKKDIKFTR